MRERLHASSNAARYWLAGQALWLGRQLGIFAVWITPKSPDLENDRYFRANVERHGPHFR